MDVSHPAPVNTDELIDWAREKLAKIEEGDKRSMALWQQDKIDFNARALDTAIYGAQRALLQEMLSQLNG